MHQEQRLKDEIERRAGRLSKGTSASLSEVNGRATVEFREPKPGGGIITHSVIFKFDHKANDWLVELDD